jgi:RHS repeat-associated protein
VVYTLKPATFGNLISRSGGGVDSFHLFDALGSARQLANGAASVTDTYLYDSFGNLLLGTGLTVNPFRYVGRRGYYFDIDLSAYSVRARLYNPIAGRFIARDPVIVPGRSLYVYVENQPLSAVDPSGALTIKAIPPAVIGDQPCGATLTMKWRYSFREFLRPCDGYMVQKFDSTCSVDECGMGSDGYFPKYVWEAYPSETGGSIVDTATSYCRHNEYGAESHKVEVRFYCSYVLDEAKDPPQTWAEYPVIGGGSCATKMGQYATTNTPTFWNDRNKYPYRDGPAYRTFKATYDCCNLCSEIEDECFGEGSPGL